MSSQDDSSISLDSDSEVNEFEDDASQQNVSRWEPDAWDGEDSHDDLPEHGLAKIPLSILAKARKAIEVSKYEPGESSTSQQKDNPKKRETDSRTSKNASPTVMSSKKQVKRARQVIDIPQTSRRDPRFSAVSAGAVDMHFHNKSYDFIPTLLREEFNTLKDALSVVQKAERTCSQADKDRWIKEREKLERLVAQTRTRIERGERESRDREVIASAKKEERDKRSQGKGAWYMKKGAQRDLLLKAKFDALEERGGKVAVKRAMDKKRKKIASKEKKSRPV